jgi:hypothetical protein
LAECTSFGDKRHVYRTMNLTRPNKPLEPSLPLSMIKCRRAAQRQSLESGCYSVAAARGSALLARQSDASSIANNPRNAAARLRATITIRRAR